MHTVEQLWVLGNVWALDRAVGPRDCKLQSMAGEVPPVVQPCRGCGLCVYVLGFLFRCKLFDMAW
jgi:hypothetical protein